LAPSCRQHAGDAAALNLAHTLSRRDFNRNHHGGATKRHRNTAPLQSRLTSRGSLAMNTAAAFADTVPAHWSLDTAAPPVGWVDSASNVLTRWLDTARSRETLDELDDHVLRDIGLTRHEAQREARKFFWQA
jgi:uncharacterized protein YjiS (DUF1127 family)